MTSIAVWTWTRSIALEIFVIHALRMNAKGLRPTNIALASDGYFQEAADNYCTSKSAHRTTSSPPSASLILSSTV